MPRVSVLMSVYNGERFLREAIDSILAQTFGDFECILIDDGSTDGTAEMLDTYTDPRLVRLKNETNIGLTRSLNRGLEAAQGDYIARMDGDDVSESGRFAGQVAYLDAYPDVVALGTWFRCYDEQGIQVGESEIPSDPALIAWLMGWQCAIGHATVMMRRESVLALGGYDVERRYAQDYDLWTRLIMSGGKVSVLPSQEVKIRVLADGISAARRDQQRECAVEIAQRYAEWRLGMPMMKEHVAGMLELLSAAEALPGTSIHGTLDLMSRIQRRSEQECDRVSVRHIRQMASEKRMGIALHNSYRCPKLSALLLADTVRHDPGQLLHGETWKQMVRIAVAPLRHSRLAAAASRHRSEAKTIS